MVKITKVTIKKLLAATPDVHIEPLRYMAEFLHYGLRECAQQWTTDDVHRALNKAKMDSVFDHAKGCIVVF